MPLTMLTYRRRFSLLWLYFTRLFRYSLILSAFAATIAGMLVTAGVIAGSGVVVGVGGPEVVDGIDAANGPSDPGRPFPVRLAVVLAGVLIATLGHWLGVTVMRLAHAREAPFYEAGGWHGSTLAFASWPLSMLAGAIVIVVGPLVVQVVGGA